MATVEEETAELIETKDTPFQNSFKLKPEIFTPTFTSSKSQLIDLVEESAKSNVETRMYRLILIIFLFAFFLPFTYFTRDKLPLLTIFGISLLCIFTGYMFHLYYILFNAHLSAHHGLYRVYTLNNIPPNWAKMSISHTTLLYRFHPIHSISEFSAIQGGTANSMLSGVTICTLSIVVCAFASEIHDHSFGIYPDDSFTLMGALGLVIIGTFELDPFNSVMKQFHNVGVLLTLGIFVAFNFQQINMAYSYSKYTYARIWYPLFLDIISVFGFVKWVSNIRKCKVYQHELRNGSATVDTAKISKLSIKNLVFEGIYFAGAGLSLCSWLIFYPYNCEKCT